MSVQDDDLKSALGAFLGYLKAKDLSRRKQSAFINAFEAGFIQQYFRSVKTGLLDRHGKPVDVNGEELEVRFAKRLGDLARTQQPEVTKAEVVARGEAWGFLFGLLRFVVTNPGHAKSIRFAQREIADGIKRLLDVLLERQDKVYPILVERYEEMVHHGDLSILHDTERKIFQEYLVFLHDFLHAQPQKYPGDDRRRS